MHEPINNEEKHSNQTNLFNLAETPIFLVSIDTYFCWCHSNSMEIVMNAFKSQTTINLIGFKQRVFSLEYSMFSSCREWHESFFKCRWIDFVETKRGIFSSFGLIEIYVQTSLFTKFSPEKLPMDKNVFAAEEKISQTVTILKWRKNTQSGEKEISYSNRKRAA